MRLWMHDIIASLSVFMTWKSHKSSPCGNIEIREPDDVQISLYLQLIKSNSIGFVAKPEEP